jgi:Uncharacterized protein conserved in archaea
VSQYLLNLLRRSRRLFITLVKVMLPVMAAVEIGQQLGWVDALGRAIGPAMAWLALPPEAGLVWVTGACVGVYGAIAALIGLAPSMDLTAAQFSALCAMILFTHALPVEQAIVRRAGASFWATGALRVGAALLYGGAVSWVSRWTGVLDQPAPLHWLHDTALAPGGDGGLAAWLQATALSLALTYAVIVALLVLLDVFERTGVNRLLTAALSPLLRVSGLDPRATPVTMVGVLLGLSYGGALIIEEADKQQFPRRTRFLALSWLSLSHSLIEDTALFLAMGADIWVILVGRVLLTLVVVALLARLPWGGEPAAGTARAIA